MAHELEVNDQGEIEMAYCGAVPWHGLGTKVSPDLTPTEFMKAAGLDWEVKKKPLFIDGVDGPEQVEGKSMLVREDSGKHLDVVGNDWNPVQNSQAFDFFDDVVDSGNMHVSTAGALLGGRRVWAMAEINDQFELFGGDIVKGNLLFCNPHTYGETITVQFSPVRVVCNNTLQMALHGKSQKKVSWSHRLVWDKELVQDMLGISHVRMGEYKEMAEFLGSRRVPEDQHAPFFASCFPTKVRKEADETKVELGGRNAKRAFELLEEQPGAEFAEGSYWQAFNAATYFIDHVMGKSHDSRMNNAYFGYGVGYKKRAMEQALDHATKHGVPA